MIVRLIRIFLAASVFVIVMSSLVIAIEEVFRRHQNYDYFYEALDRLPETHEIIDWTDTQPKGRTIEENNRYDFGIELTEAWKAYAMAMGTGKDTHLKDYFAGPALERGLHILNSEEAEGANMVMMGMEVDPVFFHLDGSYFQFRSNNAMFARFKITGDQLEAFSFSEECILSNLFIRQTGWKVINVERDCSEEIDNSLRAPKWDLPPLKGINYYPKNSPWSFFWRDYDPYVVRSDLRRISSLGANSVRIFLPKDVFTETEVSKEALENLEDFLEQTEKANIFVIPTLFDFRGELTPWSWLEDRYYLDQVLPVLGAHENIAYVDLKNELDLDDRFQSPALVEAWVRTIAALSRHLAPDLRYSIGWSNAENALRFGEYLDVISYHDYSDVENSQASYEKTKADAQGKPVIVSEVGATSYDFIFSQPSNLDKQAASLKTRLDQFAGSDGVLVWSLYDYPVLDPKAVSGSFWHKGIQKNFGLLDIYEARKPAAQIFEDWSPNEHY